ncbi:MAG: hypothetical protein ABSD13_16170 [Candidatus Korobacteraceae bacterium]|jgi:hypothetical protein
MTWLRRAVRLLPIVALFVLGTSCDGFFVSNSSIETVTIGPSAVFLKAGVTPADSYSTLSFTSLTAGGTKSTDAANASWTSSDTSIATVVAGVLTAGTATSGTSTITAKDGGTASNACTVVLYTGTAPTTLTVASQTGATAFAAGTFQAIASASFAGDTGLSSNITPYVTWSSSDTTGTIATVNSAGVVTVLSATTPFTITATATFGAAASPATVTAQQEFNNTTII